MKIIYKNAELQHNNRSYNVLINRPSLNGRLLEGNVSLDTLQLYDKPTTEKLVEATSQIRLVSTMPADPEANMTYYVGPDERNLYDVILVNDAKQQIHMGTTQFGQYKSGPGVNVKFDNTINVNTDDVSIYIDSEGNIASSLDGEALPAFTGATASAAGTKGLVPQPLKNESEEILCGDSTWKALVDLVFPIGSLQIMYGNANDPGSRFPGTTWERLSSGYILWNDSSGGGGKIEDEGIPDVSGTWTRRISCKQSVIYSNAFYDASYSSAVDGVQLTGSGYCKPVGNRYVYFDTSGNTATGNAAYGTSDHVTPPAYLVNVWRRTA